MTPGLLVFLAASWWMDNRVVLAEESAPAMKNRVAWFDNMKTVLMVGIVMQHVFYRMALRVSQLLPLSSSPTFGYTKEKLRRGKGGFVVSRRVVETCLLVAFRGRGGCGRAYYSSVASARGVPGGSRWTCPPEREWGCCCSVWGG